MTRRTASQRIYRSEQGTYKIAPKTPRGPWWVYQLVKGEWVPVKGRAWFDRQEEAIAKAKELCGVDE